MNSIFVDLSFLLFLLSQSSLFVRGNDFDGCNLMVYSDDGQFSARDTLLACSAQMASPILPVSYDPNFDSNLTVYAQLVSTLCNDCTMNTILLVPGRAILYFMLLTNAFLFVSPKGINNLISVDEVASTIALDFYYRNTWTDPRWKMNESFWTQQRPDIDHLVHTHYRQSPFNKMDIF